MCIDNDIPKDLEKLAGNEWAEELKKASIEMYGMIFNNITPQELVRICIYSLTKDRACPPGKNCKEIYMDMGDIAIIFAELKETYRAILDWYLYNASDPERPYSRALAEVWSTLEMALLYRPLDCCRLKYFKLGFDDKKLYDDIVGKISKSSDQYEINCLYDFQQFLEAFVRLAKIAEQENIDAYNEYMKPREPIIIPL